MPQNKLCVLSKGVWYDTDKIEGIELLASGVPIEDFKGFDYFSFEKSVMQARKENPRWRAGQTLFNVFHITYPYLSHLIRATNIDPFYQDKKIHEFISYLKKRR